MQEMKRFNNMPVDKTKQVACPLGLGAMDGNYPLRTGAANTVKATGIR